jgi:hypothetical protein
LRRRRCDLGGIEGRVFEELAGERLHGAASVAGRRILAMTSIFRIRCGRKPLAGG